MNKFTGSKAMRAVLSAAALAVLAACGGGGDSGNGSGAGAAVSVGGTVARGAALANATVVLTCANKAVLTGVTGPDGTYLAANTPVTYPCIGTAKTSSITYRGILFTGSTANFSPLTDMLVEVVLAAAASGSGSLTLDAFLAKVQTDAAFAASVTSATTVTSYRTAVVDVVRAQLVASGLTTAQANAILADAGNFDSTPFAIGSPLDKVLDNTGSILLDASGNVRGTVTAAASTKGDTLPSPTAGATGATGATGGSGSGG